MYLRCLTILIIHLAVGPVLAQPCPEGNIATDSLQHLMLRQYIQECHLKRFDYTYDHVQKRNMPMGIIHVTEYIDSRGDKVWRLSKSLNDSYREYPPKAYDVVGHDVVLLYEADSLGNMKYQAIDSSYIKCLDEIITDRVYRRPPKTFRWYNGDTNDSAKHKMTVYGTRTGISYDYYIIFHRNGKYTVHNMRRNSR
jgi:hypothetical protein